MNYHTKSHKFSLNFPQFVQRSSINQDNEGLLSDSDPEDLTKALRTHIQETFKWYFDNFRLNQGQQKLSPNIIDEKYIIICKFGNENDTKKQVYLVEDIITLERQVLKIFTLKEQEEFLHEAVENFKLVESPFLIKMNGFEPAYIKQQPFTYSGYTIDFYSYILVPYCPKGALIDVLLNANKKKVMISDQLTSYIIGQIIRGTDFLENVCKMSHCDLKCDNVIITNDDGMALIDFGHAQPANQGCNQELGTEPYLPPELRKVWFENSKEQYNPQKFDTFTLGVMIFTVLFKHPPFKQATPYDPFYSSVVNNDFYGFFRKHLRGQKKPESALVLIWDCIRANPQDRIDIRQAKLYSYFLNATTELNDNLRNELYSLLQ